MPYTAGNQYTLLEPWGLCSMYVSEILDLSFLRHFDQTGVQLLLDNNLIRNKIKNKNIFKKNECQNAVKSQLK